MKILVLLSLLILLTGCSMETPVWETVEDLPREQTVSGWREHAYDMAVGLPDTVLTDETEDCLRYETEDLQVELHTFLSSDPESAIRYLSGFSWEELTVFQTTRFDLPEYRFAWYAQTEEGGRLYRADLVMDGMTCYAVLCSAPEEAGPERWERARQVFSDFALIPADQV